MEFFDNLLIRATQKYALNDPFELSPSHREGEFENITHDKNESNTSYYDYAIISLSETNNNLLMWSHYADQHKGIVIEFDEKKPLFESYKDFTALRFDYELDYEIIDEEENNRRLGINAGKIQRVRYNAKRPDIQNFDNILEHFLVKSEEWIYEKEHRVILPLLTSDFIIANEKYLDKISFTLYNDEYFEKTKISESMYLINIKKLLVSEGERYYLEAGVYGEQVVSDEDFKRSFIESIYREYLKDISEDPTTVFLYKTPPESIKAIYLGCRVNTSTRNELINKIKKNKSLSHLQIFQAIPSFDRFELTFKKL